MGGVHDARRKNGEPLLDTPPILSLYLSRIHTGPRNIPDIMHQTKSRIGMRTRWGVLTREQLARLAAPVGLRSSCSAIHPRKHRAQPDPWDAGCCRERVHPIGCGSKAGAAAHTDDRGASAGGAPRYARPCPSAGNTVMTRFSSMAASAAARGSLQRR